MGAKKNVSKPDPRAEALLAELAGDSPDDKHDAWDGVADRTLAELVIWATRAGYLLTVGAARSGSGVYLSLRLGSSYRQWTLDGRKEDTHQLEQLTAGMKRQWLHAQQEAKEEEL